MRHVTVIEEAHRLLARAPAQTGPEQGNPRGKAVETFVNMLSEIRAYGEGFVVAEQIPTKLAPDVIKNTALKIMHRIVANDDRQAMGGAMNLTPAQVRHVVSLGVGQAVVHGGGRHADDGAVLVQVPLAKSSAGQIPSGAEIHTSWRQFTDRHNLQALYLGYPTCRMRCQPPNPDCREALRIAEKDTVAAAYGVLLAGLVGGSPTRSEAQLAGLLSLSYDNLLGEVRHWLVGAQEDKSFLHCLLTHCHQRYVEERGSQYGWDYQTVARLAGGLLPALAACAAQQAPSAKEREMMVQFCQEYVSSCRLGFEPFYGCGPTCGTPPVCLYRYDVQGLLVDEELNADFADAEATAQGLLGVCQDAAERVVALPSPGRPGFLHTDQKAIEAAALCYLIQKTHKNPSAWPKGNRVMLIDEMLVHYGRMPSSGLI